MKENQSPILHQCHKEICHSCFHLLWTWFLLFHAVIDEGPCTAAIIVLSTPRSSAHPNTDSSQHHQKHVQRNNTSRQTIVSTMVFRNVFPLDDQYPSLKIFRMLCIPFSSNISFPGYFQETMVSQETKLLLVITNAWILSFNTRNWRREAISVRAPR